MGRSVVRHTVPSLLDRIFCKWPSGHSSTPPARPPLLTLHIRVEYSSTASLSCLAGAGPTSRPPVICLLLGPLNPVLILSTIHAVRLSTLYFLLSLGSGHWHWPESLTNEIKKNEGRFSLRDRGCELPLHCILSIYFQFSKSNSERTIR